jgi:hypothetical protein
VAEAADIASDAPTSLAGAPGWLEPVGKRISTTLSQNAIRNRKNMKPTSPAADVAASGGKLAGSIESRVRVLVRILRIIDENTRQIFDQFEKIQFT